MNNTEKTGEEFLREMDAEQAGFMRRYWIGLAIVCTVPFAIAGALHLIAVLT